MSMNITNISNNVQAILSAMDKFVDVIASPPEEYDEDQPLKFTGYPSAMHYYENTDSSPATVTQNRRVIFYTVQIVMVIPSNANLTPAQKMLKAYAIIDDVIQKFDESRDLSTDTLPRACDIMRPVPGDLERISTTDGQGLMMTIRLACEADIAFLSL